MQKGQAEDAMRVEFQEDENVIEMGVDASKFPSDGEDSESEPDSENDEVLEQGFLDPEQQKAEENRENNTEYVYVRNPEFGGNVENTAEQDREERIVNKTVAKLQQLMAMNGYKSNPENTGEIQFVNSEINFNLNANRSSQVGQSGTSFSVTEEQGGKTGSIGTLNYEVTLYKTTVQPEGQKKVKQKVSIVEQAKESDHWRRSSGWGLSSSDEDQVNTSDELNEQVTLFLNTIKPNQFIANGNVTGPQEEQPRPSTSRAPTQDLQQEMRQLTPPVPSIQDYVDRLIRDAENAKARINDVQGMTQNISPMENLPVQLQVNSNVGVDLENRFVHSTMVDKDYLVVAGHVDENTARKIKLGEYVDFSKLLPRDRVIEEQNRQLQLIATQDGHLSCTTSGQDQQGSISSFGKWEQAFRVYSNIYTREYPQRASELIQYNHVISTAAVSYAWNNVYAYDIDFCLHMAHHPMRSWSVILQ